MSVYKYFKAKPSRKDSPYIMPSLTRKDLKVVSKAVAVRVKSEQEAGDSTRGKYNEYLAAERARIGKYAAENGPTRASRHFSNVLKRPVPETTARRLKKEYLAAMKSAVSSDQSRSCSSDSAGPIVVTTLPKAARDLSILEATRCRIFGAEHVPKPLCHSQ